MSAFDATDAALDAMGFPPGDARVFWRAFQCTLDHDDFAHGFIALAAHLPSDWTVSRAAVAAAQVDQWAGGQE